MKKIITVLLLSILFLVLDNALMPFFSIKGAYPSLLFVFAVCYSIISGSWSSIYIGVLSGLLQDVYLINGLGINMLLNMLICLIAAEIGKTIFKDKSVVPIIACFFLSLLKGVLMFAILYVVRQFIDVKLILYISIYNMIVAIFMYKKVYTLSKVNFMMKNWKF
ncbi:rod shape-determining protein MreD [Clostridium bovifaecis]|uniref:Rod shape-determining protein MreD n=1 Tax=Clostridium bovifaecis TaxID=2184719 RepID=A0A6I6EXD3_9CLOT|nr:rod shape-determining protein MreD [Clostridium bovifaecis]